ncbi:RNA-dependent RNA polymerase [Streptomyces phage Psst1]|nr:RNA-dependent RNA polymerase [Streptomyces phage Psst1]WPJ30688.1 RNA-dependent RNA polymerase [Streptomyces phage Psst2]
MTNNQGPEATKMSNLITDMTIAGASEDELKRAVKHSQAAMDYEKSAQVNGIDELIVKYQKSSISRNARVALRLMMTGRYTIEEVSETLELPEYMIRAMLDKESSKSNG